MCAQVIGKTPRWVLDLQQPVVTLQRVSPAGSKAQSAVSTSSADEVADAAETAARRLMAASAVAALAQASEASASAGTYWQICLSCNHLSVNAVLTLPHWFMPRQPVHR